VRERERERERQRERERERERVMERELPQRVAIIVEHNAMIHLNPIHHHSKYTSKE
jgi:hypothetical protein